MGHDEVDDHVLRAIKLAAESVVDRRFVLVIPNLSRGNDEYRKAVYQTGERILWDMAKVMKVLTIDRSIDRSPPAVIGRQLNCFFDSTCRLITTA